MGNLFSQLSPEALSVQAMVLYRIHKVILSKALLIKNKPFHQTMKTKPTTNTTNQRNQKPGVD